MSIYKRTRLDSLFLREPISISLIAAQLFQDGEAIGCSCRRWFVATPPQLRLECADIQQGHAVSPHSKPYAKMALMLQGMSEESELEVFGRILTTRR
jgi:hypothetical protein